MSVKANVKANGSVTQSIVSGETTHTQGWSGRSSFLNVKGKDPNFDYSFQRRIKLEEGGGVTVDGWAAVNAENHAGEKADGPASWANTAAKKEIRFEDVVLCKRPKYVSAQLKMRETEKYNRNARLIRDAAPQARMAFREAEARMGLSPKAGAKIEFEGDVQQVTGPTID